MRTFAILIAAYLLAAASAWAQAPDLKVTKTAASDPVSASLTSTTSPATGE